MPKVLYFPLCKYEPYWVYVCVLKLNDVILWLWFVFQTCLQMSFIQRWQDWLNFHYKLCSVTHLHNLKIKCSARVWCVTLLIGQLNRCFRMLDLLFPKAFPFSQVRKRLPDRWLKEFWVKKNQGSRILPLNYLEREVWAPLIRVDENNCWLTVEASIIHLI